MTNASHGRAGRPEFGSLPAVREGTADDLCRAANLLAESFAADPVAHWHFPDPVRRTGCLPGFFTLFLEEALRVKGLLVTDDLSGVRIFTPPECAGATGSQAPDAEALRAATGPDAPRTLQLFDLLEAHHPRDRPHYHLVFSAVRPHLRGNGIGTATLRHVLKRADDERVGTYVESSTTRSRRLVLRHGFTPLPPIDLPGAGPSLHPSWREPMVSG